MSIFIRNMLDISTGHLTKDTRRRMDEDSVNFAIGKDCSLPFSVKGSSFGWFIDVRDAAERSYALEPYPFDIIDCYILAINLECKFILFDRDAERHPELNWYGNRKQEAYNEKFVRLPLVAEYDPYQTNDIRSLFNR